MGCSNSKVDNEEGVARCKQRKRLMKQTVTSRHHFAASHAQFIMSLRGVGAAFRQFAEGEVKDGSESSHHPDTPTTPVGGRLLLGPPSLSPGMSSVQFSPSPPSSPAPRTKRSSLRKGSPVAASSPDSTMSNMDFLPPPPPHILVKEYRMEHTPPIIPTKIYRYPALACDFSTMLWESLQTLSDEMCVPGLKMVRTLGTCPSLGTGWSQSRRRHRR